MRFMTSCFLITIGLVLLKIFEELFGVFYGAQFRSSAYEYAFPSTFLMEGGREEGASGWGSLFEAVASLSKWFSLSGATTASFDRRVR